MLTPFSRYVTLPGASLAPHVFRSVPTDTFTGTQALPAPERAGYRPSQGGWGSGGGDRGDRPERSKSISNSWK